MLNRAWLTVAQAQRGDVPGDMALEVNPMGVVKLTLMQVPIEGLVK